MNNEFITPPPKNNIKKLLHLSGVDHLIEDVDVKVTEKPVRYSPTHFHDFYEIEIISKGNIVSEMNGKVYNMPQGSMVFITPSDVHSYHDVGEGNDVTILNLSFATKDFEYNSFIANILSGSSFICTPSKEIVENLTFLIKKIDKESQIKDTLNKRYISYLLSCIMLELKRLKREYRITSAKNDFDTGRRALVYIRNHFKEQITLEDVAKFMNICPVYASRIIHKTLGYGFKEYLMNLRLEYAAGLLTHTEENIANISYYAGYNTASYFTRGFSKKYGMTPAQYREYSRKVAYE